MKPSADTKRWRALIDRASDLLDRDVVLAQDVAHATALIQCAAEMRIADKARQIAQTDGRTKPK